MKRGLLIVISGPSGVGKGTIIRELLKKRPNARLSVSCTTRQPRPGEVDGVHYFFIQKEEFTRMIDADEFLEYMPVFDNFYGTPKKKVEELRDAGIDVILDIDVNGAEAVRSRAQDAVSIFILPPSLEELRRRLTSRGTETAEQIEKRTQRVQAEMAKSGDYDYTVVNEILKTAVCEIQDIIEKEHLKK